MIYKDPRPSDAAMPDALAACLLEAVVPVAAQSDRLGAMRGRLLDKVRGDPAASADDSAPSPAAPGAAAAADAAHAFANAFITLRGSTQQDAGWIELLPKAHAKLLFSDGIAESYMIRLEPGAWAPSHEHPADEECLVLEGSLWQGDVFLKAGDFHVARRGMKHGELRTETGALVFIRYARPLGEYIRL